MNIRPFLPLLALTLTAHATDWPMYRGPKGDGSTPDKLPLVWPAAGPKQLWKVPSTNGFSSFAVGGGKCFTIEGREADGTWRPLREFSEPYPREVRSQGFNTDADAITRSMREDLGIELRGAKVLLLGAGGAGRVAALKLAAECVAELFLVNRTAEKAEAIAAEIRQRFPAVKVSAGYPGQRVNLLLNATSLGLKPDDPSPLDTKRFSASQAEAVYDMIYRPAETPLLRAARAAGCRTANGIGMLLYQGARALELWTGRNPPITVMRLRRISTPPRRCRRRRRGGRSRLRPLNRSRRPA